MWVSRLPWYAALSGTSTASSRAAAIHTAIASVPVGSTQTTASPALTPSVTSTEAQDATCSSNCAYVAVLSRSTSRRKTASGSCFARCSRMFGITFEADSGSTASGAIVMTGSMAYRAPN